MMHRMELPVIWRVNGGPIASSHSSLLNEMIDIPITDYCRRSRIASVSGLPFTSLGSGLCDVDMATVASVELAD